MGYIVTKLLLSLILPPAGPLIMVAAGFASIRSCRGFGRFLIAGGFTLIYALSISPVSNALLKPLETGFPAAKTVPAATDAIVVLGGGVSDQSWLELPSVPSTISLERLIKGITLYRTRRLPLVFVGGNGDPWRTMTPDADTMAAAARALGVASKDIAVENKSRNTIEGARALKGLIKGRGTVIILVTSASHMKRASAMFSKQGFRVIPAASGYRYDPEKLSLHAFIPSAKNMADSSIALSEYISYFWYSANGSL